MPALLPDIFSAAIKGYEDANNANWQDLKNYEAIEAARTANDVANLGLIGSIEDYANNREISNAAGTQANIAALLLRAAAPAQLNQAGLNSLVTGMQFGAAQANKDALTQGYSDTAASTAGSMSTNARMNLGLQGVTQKNAPTTLAGVDAMTQGQGQAAIIAGNNLPKQAQQTVDQSNANFGANMQATKLAELTTQGAIANQPLVQQTQTAQLQNANYVQNQALISAAEQKLQTLQSQYSTLAAGIQQHNANAANYAKMGMAQMARNEQANGLRLQEQQRALMAQIEQEKQNVAAVRARLGTATPAAPLISTGQ